MARLQAGRSGVQGLAGIFLYSGTSVRALGPTQPSIKWVPGASQGMKRQEREVDHSPLSGVEVRNEWSCTSVSCVCFHGMDRDYFFRYFEQIQMFKTVNSLKHSCWCM